MGDRIRGFLTARPFFPFRIVMCDGSGYEIDAPELGEVTPSVARLYAPGPGLDRGPWRCFLSLNHVRAVEPVADGRAVVLS